MDRRPSKRTTIAASVAAALATLVIGPGVAGASHEPGDGGGARDFAVGTGTNEVGRVDFAAHGGPSPGEPVTGHFHAKGVFPATGEFNIDGPVTCLHVVGNEAGLFYPVRNPAENEPDGVYVFLRNNGNPEGGSQPDQIGFIPLVGVTEMPACPPNPLTIFNLDRGNVTIHDAVVP